MSNLSHFKNDMMPHVAEQLQTALKVDMTSDSKTLNDVVGQLDKILFDDYIKGKSVLLGRTIEKGILGDGIDWYNAPKPTGGSEVKVVRTDMAKVSQANPLLTLVGIFRSTPLHL